MKAIKTSFRSCLKNFMKYGCYKSISYFFDKIFHTFNPIHDDRNGVFRNNYFRKSISKPCDSIPNWTNNRNLLCSDWIIIITAIGFFRRRQQQQQFFALEIEVRFMNNKVAWIILPSSFINKKAAKGNWWAIVFQAFTFVSEQLWRWVCSRVDPKKLKTRLKKL